MDKHSESQGSTRHKFYKWLAYPDLTPQERKTLPKDRFWRVAGRQQGRDMRKTIRVRKWTYDQLRDVGKMGMDFDDAITKLIKDYKERHK